MTMMTVPTGHAGEFAHPGVEDVPRRGAEVGVDEQGDTEPEHRQPGHAPGDPLRGSVGGDEAVHARHGNDRKAITAPQKMAVTPPRHDGAHAAHDTLCRM